MAPLALFLHNGTIDHLLAGYGYAVVFALVAAESLGVPVPGETTLILAALYAGATHRLAIWLVVAVAAGGAIVGDNVGYAIGRYGGWPLLRRHGRKIRIDERRLKVGVWVFRRHGGKVVFFGRFVSILRTYAAFLAGATRMRWPAFLVFNAAGGIVWATIYGVAYYEFGTVLKGLGPTIDAAIGAVALAVAVAGVVWLRRKRRELEERADAELDDDVLRELEPDAADLRRERERSRRG